MAIAVDFSYEPFSREPEYVELNEQFMHGVDLAGRADVLDLACGTATLTTLIRSALDGPGRGHGRPAGIVGLDLCRESLLLARTFLEGAGAPAVPVRLVQASADRIPLADDSMDAVVMGNAIQLVPDKALLVSEVARVLRPGGLFAFNTSFYAGAYVPSTRRFYIRWVEEALAIVKREIATHPDAAGNLPSRTKGLGKPAFSNRWLSNREYAELLKHYGLTVLRASERVVMLNQRCLEAIGAYAGLASVLLSGYPVDLACRALVESTRPALEAAGVEAVPRQWLEMTAVCR